MKCPKCGDTEQIDIRVHVWVRVIQDDSDNLETDADQSLDGTHDWDGGDSAHCCACDYYGLVCAFEAEVTTHRAKEDMLS